MDDSKRAWRLLLRTPAVWTLAGFCLFLIGAQLPYAESCSPHIGCFRWRLMDLTPELHTNNDSWAVTASLARLMPVLAAIYLMHRAQLHRRQAAGFVAVAGIILIGVYLFVAMSPLFAVGAWEPGAALWPLGATLMLIAAARSRKEDAAPPDGPERDRIGWLMLLAFGIVLILAALWIDVVPAAYLFALGTTALVTGILIASPGRASGPRFGHIWIRRLLALPLLVGAAMIALPSFFAFGDRPEPTVRVEFLFAPERPDLWDALLTLAIVAGVVMAAVDVMRRGSIGRFSLGGATAGATWVFVPAIIAFAGSGDWLAPDREADVNLTLGGVGLIWATLLLPLARHNGASNLGAHSDLGG